VLNKLAPVTKSAFVLLSKGSPLLRLQAKRWVRIQFQWTLEIVKRTEEHTFKVLPKRWIVERTFARISFHRRLSKDYERLPESGMAFIQLSMIRLMVNRISK